jgi:hypothetical protein
MALLRKRPLTPAALAARRANAQKSTGPRTAAGKARSRLNALKHGRNSRLAQRYFRLWLDCVVEGVRPGRGLRVGEMPVPFALPPGRDPLRAALRRKYLSSLAPYVGAAPGATGLERRKKEFYFVNEAAK